MTHPNPTSEADVWTWQVQAMVDLAEFLRAHGPESRTPLLPVAWTFGQGWTVTAEISTHSSEPHQAIRALVALHAMSALGDYAEALDTEVEYFPSQDRTRLVCLVQGRIGPADADGQPRTLLVLSTTAHRNEPMEVTR